MTQPESSVPTVKAKWYALSYPGNDPVLFFRPPQGNDWHPVNVEIVPPEAPKPEPANPQGLKFVRMWRQFGWIAGKTANGDYFVSIQNGPWHRATDFDRSRMLSDCEIEVPPEYAVTAAKSESETGEKQRPVGGVIGGRADRSVTPRHGSPVSDFSQPAPKVLREWKYSQHDRCIHWRIANGRSETRGPDGVWRKWRDSFADSERTPEVLVTMMVAAGCTEVWPGTDTPITEPKPSEAFKAAAEIEASTPIAVGTTGQIDDVEDRALSSGATSHLRQQGAIEPPRVMSDGVPGDPYADCRRSGQPNVSLDHSMAMLAKRYADSTDQAVSNRLARYCLSLERRITELTEQLAGAEKKLSELTKPKITVGL